MFILPYAIAFMWIAFIVLFYLFTTGKIQSGNPDTIVKIIVGLFLSDIAATIFMGIKYHLRHRKLNKPDDDI